MESFQIEIILGLSLLVLLGFLATIDIAVSKLSDVQLRRLMSDAEDEGRGRFASILKSIIADRGRFRLVSSIAMQVLQVWFTVLVTTSTVSDTSGNGGTAALALALSIAASLVVRHLVPFILLRPNPEATLGVFLPVAAPFYRGASMIAGLFSRARVEDEEHRSIAPDKTATEEEDEERDDDEFQALMEVGEAEGIIEEEDRELIETVVNFSDTIVAEIMTPRTEICALPMEATVTEARDLMISEKYSRVPVFRDNIDNIEGLIYIRDLLAAWAEGKEEAGITEMVRPALFVPETKPVAELLKKMQAQHIQIAIVIDEYGGVAGLLSVEDIVEELVGEIEDEDTEKEEVLEVVAVGEECFDVDGATDIDKIEKLFDLELDGGDFTTIAGMITSEAGLVPKVGESLVMRGLLVEILRADEKRVLLARIRRASAESGGQESDT